MPTVGELINRLTELKDKQAVLEHLIEYVDSTFRGQAGQEPPKKLLNESKLPVPETTIEAVVTDVLLFNLNAVREDITNISSTTIEEET